MINHNMATIEQVVTLLSVVFTWAESTAITQLNINELANMLGSLIWIAADDVRKHNSQVARNKMLLVVRDPWQRLLKLLQNYLQTRFVSKDNHHLLLITIKAHKK